MSVTVKLRGLNKATKILAGGKRVTYWYAWRGGPKLPGKPGEPQFLLAYAEAHKSRKKPSTTTLAALTSLFKASPEFQRNAKSTKREWSRWLDRIALGELGHYGYDALSDPDVRADLLAWRDQWRDNPRTADYAIQVLSRVLAWGCSRRLVKINAAEGIERLYQSDRSDVIWTNAEIADFVARAPSSEVGFIIPLACLTGLRREDLANLLWSEVGELYISKSTGKSRHRKTATIPIFAQTRELIKKIKTQQAKYVKSEDVDKYVLTNTRGKQWTPSGLSHAVAPFGGKRLHDCRGTFITEARKAGCTATEIADMVGWDDKRVMRLLSVYVARDQIVRELAERIGKR